MATHRTKPLSENQRRKRYRQIVSRKRKHTRFEVESWKQRDEEERSARALADELDELAFQHFNEI